MASRISCSKPSRISWSKTPGTCLTRSGKRDMYILTFRVKRHLTFNCHGRDFTRLTVENYDLDSNCYCTMLKCGILYVELWFFRGCSSHKLNIFATHAVKVIKNRCLPWKRSDAYRERCINHQSLRSLWKLHILNFIEIPQGPMR